MSRQHFCSHFIGHKVHMGGCPHFKGGRACPVREKNRYMGQCVSLTHLLFIPCWEKKRVSEDGAKEEDRKKLVVQRFGGTSDFVDRKNNLHHQTKLISTVNVILTLNARAKAVDSPKPILNSNMDESQKIYAN